MNRLAATPHVPLFAALLMSLSAGCEPADLSPPFPRGFHRPPAIASGSADHEFARAPAVDTAKAFTVDASGPASPVRNEIILIYDAQAQAIPAEGKLDHNRKLPSGPEYASVHSDSAPSLLPGEPAVHSIGAVEPASNTDNDIAPLAGPSDPTPELVAIARQADTHIAHALSLAERGAMYSARAQLLQALRLSAAALDGQRRTTAHSRALASAWCAIEEANDFMRAAAAISGPVSTATLAEGHRTQVLTAEELTEISPTQAAARYLSFAERQLGIAGGDLQPAASALYALGKLQMTQATREIGSPESARAVLFFQAALLVNPRHALAANELGVILARHGRLPEAKAALQYSVQIQPQPAAWRNLAIVHHGMGELDLAARADHQWRQATSASPSPVETASAPAVEWVDPATFVASARMHDHVGTITDGQQLAPPISSQARPAPSASDKGSQGKSSSAWLPWRRAAR